jgi:hypothetical protein
MLGSLDIRASFEISGIDQEDPKNPHLTIVLFPLTLNVISELPQEF